MLTGQKCVINTRFALFLFVAGINIEGKEKNFKKKEISTCKINRLVLL